MRGEFLLPPHDTTPAAVITYKKRKFRSFKSKETFIRKKEDGPECTVLTTPDRELEKTTITNTDIYKLFFTNTSLSLQPMWVKHFTMKTDGYRGYVYGYGGGCEVREEVC